MKTLKRMRSEVERQELISELRRLRVVGVNVDRQEAIVKTLREQFELGWPDMPSSLAYRRKSSNGMSRKGEPDVDHGV